MHAARRRRGSSLVELLIVAAITSVALVATASAVLEANELSGRNAQVRAAAPVLASLMEEVRGTPFSAIVSTYAGQKRPVTGIPGAKSWAVFTVSDVPTGSPRWLVRRVEVQLTWTGHGGSRDARAVTYIADRTSGTGGT